MSRICPITSTTVLYPECLECDEKVCRTSPIKPDTEEDDPLGGIEIGNLLFGHSRGNFRVERHPAQELFGEFFEKLGIDHYGHPDKDSPVFQEMTDDHVSIDNELFTLRPYYWGEDEEIASLPNFVYKPEEIEIRWYKYPMRDSYSNVELTDEQIKNILEICLKSVESGRRCQND